VELGEARKLVTQPERLAHFLLRSRELVARWGPQCTLTPPHPYLKGAWYPGGFNPRTYQVKTPVSRFAFQSCNLRRYGEGIRGVLVPPTGGHKKSFPHPGAVPPLHSRGAVQVKNSPLTLTLKAPGDPIPPGDPTLEQPEICDISWFLKNYIFPQMGQLVWRYGVAKGTLGMLPQRDQEVIESRQMQLMVGGCTARAFSCDP
jgi:hypothetical protein